MHVKPAQAGGDPAGPTKTASRLGAEILAQRVVAARPVHRLAAVRHRLGIEVGEMMQIMHAIAAHMRAATAAASS